MYLNAFLRDTPGASADLWFGHRGDVLTTVHLGDPGSDPGLSLVGTPDEVERLERALAEARERRCGTPHLFHPDVLARTEVRGYRPPAAVLEPEDPRDDPTLCTRCGGRIVPAYPAPFCGCRDLEPVEVS